MTNEQKAYIIKLIDLEQQLTSVVENRQKEYDDAYDQLQQEQQLIISTNEKIDKQIQKIKTKNRHELDIFNNLTAGVAGLLTAFLLLWFPLAIIDAFGIVLFLITLLILTGVTLAIAIARKINKKHPIIKELISFAKCLVRDIAYLHPKQFKNHKKGYKAQQKIAILNFEKTSAKHFEEKLKTMFTDLQDAKTEYEEVKEILESFQKTIPNFTDFVASARQDLVDAQNIATILANHTPGVIETESMGSLHFKNPKTNPTDI